MNIYLSCVSKPTSAEKWNGDNMVSLSVKQFTILLVTVYLFGKFYFPNKSIELAIFLDIKTFQFLFK